MSKRTKAKKSSKKIRVWQYEDTQDQPYSVSEGMLPTLIESLTHRLQHAEPGDEFRVKIVEMTQKEYDDLPEWG